MKIDVILLVYNRPAHSLAVLDSLVKNGVERVRAFMDKSDDPVVSKTQESMIESFRGVGLEVELYRHQQHLGLANSVRFALHTVLENADAAVVLEDDCVVRPGGMDFFREGLTRLRYDARIRSLCGYLFPCPFMRSGAAPLLLHRFCSWGWATWQDRWRAHDPDLGRVVRALERRNVRIEELAGDLAELCRLPEYLENRVDIWSVPWALEHFATGTYCAYPSDSMIENIGFDGSGKNCVPSSAFITPEQAPRLEWDWTQLVHLVENEELLKRFMDEHGLETYPSS
jgi:hypothetical protein